MRTPERIVAALALSLVLPAQAPDLAKLTADHALAKAVDADAAIAEFVPRFASAAEQLAGKQAAVPFLAWIVRNGRIGDAVAKALDELGATHAASPDLGPVLEMVPHLASYLGDERCTKFLDQVLATSQPPELQAKALFAQAVIALQETRYLDDAARALAARNLEDAKKLTKDPALARAIAATTTEPRGLAVGQVIPEIAGIDLDGVPFRLSDYRGKVVVLDFWGDW